MDLTEAASKLRDFIKDHSDLNPLLEAEENTDNFLEMCIEDALEEINNEFPPNTSWDINYVPWSLLKKGAILEVITGVGLNSARNAFSYSDGSSINVNDRDSWGRIINYFNVLRPIYERRVTNYKRRWNVDQAYGGVASEYSDLI